MSNKKNIHIIIRQVGSAYPLLSFGKLLANQGFDVSYFAYQPSENILLSEGCDFLKINNFEDYLSFQDEKTYSIMTGTSWGGADDERFWSYAREKGLFSIAWLDQTINLKERFPSKKNIQKMPHAILATNQQMVADLEEESFSSLVQSFGSPYHDELLEKTKQRVPVKNLVIFASEPTVPGFMQEHGIDDETSLLQALNFFSLRNSDTKEAWNIKIKLHPRDEKKRWLKYLEQSNDRVKLSFCEQDKVEVFNQAEFIIGMRSMFLLEAANLNIPTLSFQINAKTSSSLTDNHPFIKVFRNSEDNIDDLIITNEQDKTLIHENNFKQKLFLDFFNKGISSSLNT